MEDTKRRAAGSGDEAHRAYARGLPEESVLLLRVRDALYDGRWDEVEADLRARLEGKPYIVQLAGRIEEDLQRLATLREYERTHGVDLGAYVEPA